MFFLAYCSAISALSPEFGLAGKSKEMTDGTNETVEKRDKKNFFVTIRLIRPIISPVNFLSDHNGKTVFLQNLIKPRCIFGGKFINFSDF